MIETAVYSHRTAPGRTILDLASLALWVLSVRNTRRHFQAVGLVTDPHGAEVLVDGLGLPFDEVKLFHDYELELPSVWAMGKVAAFNCMSRPFIHLDHDVILWNALPDEILSAPVCALMQEKVSMYGRQYPFYPRHFLDDLPNVPAFVADMAKTPDAYAYNMGIFGGNDLAFIQEFCSQSFFSARDPHNARYLRTVNGTVASVYLEQYWMAAFALSKGQPIATLITEEEQADPLEKRCRELGFTHLWGDSKRTPYFRGRIIARCQQDFPADFDKCVSLTKTNEK